MKKFTYLCAILLSACLASCGGDNAEDAGILPADPAITYNTYSSNFYEATDFPVRGCFEVEKVSATIVPNDKYPEIRSDIRATIKIKTIKKPQNEGWNECGATVQLLDADEAIIAEKYATGLDELLNSIEGDVTSISAALGKGDWSKEAAEEQLQKTKYIRLSGLYCGKEGKFVGSH